MEKKVKWGVIGAGGIADRRTMPGMMLARNAEIIAVMDVNESILDGLKQKYNAKYAYNNADDLIANTPYQTAWYSLSDEDRLENFIRSAEETADFRRQTASSRIIGYFENGNGVSRTLYDNGTAVYVNRNETDCVIDGINVPASGFAIGGD